MAIDNRFHLIVRVNDTDEDSEYLGISTVFYLYTGHFNCPARMYYFFADNSHNS